MAAYISHAQTLLICRPPSLAFNTTISQIFVTLPHPQGNFAFKPLPVPFETEARFKQAKSQLSVRQAYKLG